MELDYGREKTKLLWDTGACSEVMLHNADALHIDLSRLDLIHPEIFAPKLTARPSLKFIGPPFSRTQAEVAGAIMLYCRGPADIAPGVMTTGEVARLETFEK